MDLKASYSFVSIDIDCYRKVIKHTLYFKHLKYLRSYKFDIETYKREI